MKRPAYRPSHGLNMARNRRVTMTDDELSALTSARLIASYGVTLSEAEQLIRSLRRA